MQRGCKSICTTTVVQTVKVFKTPKKTTESTAGKQSLTTRAAGIVSVVYAWLAPVEMSMIREFWEAGVPGFAQSVPVPPMTRACKHA